MVVGSANYREGDQLEDESNGFTLSTCCQLEMKYTEVTYDSARGDGSNVAFGDHGFNEAGSMSPQLLQQFE